MVNKKVLIIDDQTGIRRLLAEVMSRAGFKVLEARSGYEGADLAEKENPDIILLDMKMPGIDGLETLRRIRRENACVPVILMTAYGELELMEEAERLGITTNLGKPFDIMKVQDLIISILSDTSVACS